MFLDLRILNELRARFSEVRILKDLWLKRVLVAKQQRHRGRRHPFEMLFDKTLDMITHW